MVETHGSFPIQRTLRQQREQSLGWYDGGEAPPLKYSSCGGISFDILLWPLTVISSFFSSCFFLHLSFSCLFSLLASSPSRIIGLVSLILLLLLRVLLYTFWGDDLLLP
mmetsp:Transcript_7262/g.18951  ORF Transcript_7262/g.18951 Transcript_7262/m.18951 type:complete len:109 (-) Transcript_7262:82-408(-)